ncbi:MAG TPA: (deoxy)nucleoside triphosphate pyrophosphohydrolase [Polyangiaceae bacterium]|nr:(deoxy)nucleoside triphosphate pyrophosphohydrolase [Polyangiaceae bacterium]
MVTIHVVGAAIFQSGRCLVARRGPSMTLPDKWEFPGGKVEPGESAATALAREVAEELGLEIAVKRRLATGTAPVGSRLISLEVFAATIISGTLVLREHSQVIWATVEDLAHLDWAAADIPCVPHVQAWLRTES